LVNIVFIKKTFQPSRDDGRSFKENQPGQYIYDPMFCIHGYEDEASVVPLPFQSYIDVPLQVQYTVKPVYSGHLGEFDKMTTIDR
jgi:hypothetical protein